LGGYLPVGNENDATVSIFYLVSNGNNVAVTFCGNDAHLNASDLAISKDIKKNIFGTALSKTYFCLSKILYTFKS
jgi:hypothetical protein